MSAITEAASVVLARGADSSETLIVRRSPSLRFFGGYLVFPGGKVAADDASISIRTDNNLAADPRRVAAARELFEETGVLLARQTDGLFPPSGPHWTEARREMMADRLSFSRLLAEADLQLHATDLLLVGQLITPPFSPLRFDTSFFVAQLPEQQQADIWPGELTEGFWTSPADLLASWACGECLVSPPTLTLLEALRGRSAFDLPGQLAPLLARLHAGAIPPICFAPGVHMMPLHTVALPPTSYTNAFLVGTDHCWLIDPGAHEPDEQARLFESLNLLLAGRSLAGVVLTHHHPDHIGGVGAVVERFGVPVLAHPLTAELLRGRAPIDRLLHEGDWIDLGTAPDGSGPWHLEALHTPGHAAGHLVFHEPHYRLLLAGDLVSTLTSIVIAPPDGDLGQYLASLRRVRQLPLRMLLPAHGGPSIRPAELIDEALEHRARREEQLLAALAEQPDEVESLARRIYKGLPEPLRPLARLQVQAGLEKLQREGRVFSAGGVNGLWSLNDE